MKTRQTYCTILFITLILSLVILSCHTTAKTAVSCPEFSIKKSDNRVFHKKRNQNIFHAHKTNSKNHRTLRSKQIQTEEMNIPVTFETDRSIQISKIEFNRSLTASADNSIRPLMNHFAPSLSPNENINSEATLNYYVQDIKCDTIFLKSGATIIGKVEEIGQSEIKYRKCNNLTGPVISILKSDVSLIHYQNGTDEKFGPKDTYIPNSNYTNQVNSPFYKPEPPKTEGLAIAGFLSGVVGLFVASIPLGIIAVIFGSISLSKIKRNPGRYRGRGLAIAALIIGIVDVIGMLLILNQVMAGS